ncbi:MAG: Tm-1-like ATP-binding domain-containing protein, partial [Phenylobacterium sp.]|uniref:Tm-1-like ATP-binding domain-containing protein n=1 Tax=Phenylobacterium sp. TaxID=1871053 RepID=UPI002735EF2D
MTPPVILIVGTVDTKSDEIGFMREQVLAAGGQPLIMDVGVLAKGHVTPDVSNTDVAQAAGVTLQQVMDIGEENSAMALMAQGASALTAAMCREGQIDGLLALGGTMGTDLALDVANSLPLGVPKVVLSTVAFSPLLPPERMPPDLVMVLWAGGLYGLNSLCQSALAQAAGAVVGACRVARAPRFARPVVGMTSLGASCLKYMVQLKPELDQRGFDLAVFHTTGMGGRAFESLAAQGQFACVMDFSLQEMVNQMGGSVVSAGPDRLMGAGRKGVPMIVAPGATDLVDYPAWGRVPERFAGRPSHDHNRLIASVGIDADMRREFARELAGRLRQAQGPVHLVLPMCGIEEWDRPGAPLHDPEGLSALMDELDRCDWGGVQVSRIDAHINDAAFVRQALVVFDDWLARG